MRRILLATEGSACSNEAIQQFTELFEGHEADLARARHAVQAMVRVAEEVLRPARCWFNRA